MILREGVNVFIKKVSENKIHRYLQSNQFCSQIEKNIPSSMLRNLVQRKKLFGPFLKRRTKNAQRH
jgi:hypothetical protein